MPGMQLRKKSDRHPRPRRVRARGAVRSCMPRPSNPDSPTPRRIKRRCTYNKNAQVGSCSRDPIGYVGSPWNLHEYLQSSPPNDMDPYGLENWTHRADGVLELLHISGEDRQYHSFYGMEYSSKMDMAVDLETCGSTFEDFAITDQNFNGGIFGLDHTPLGLPRRLGGVGASIEQDLKVGQSTSRVDWECVCNDGRIITGDRHTKTVRVGWVTNVVFMLLVDLHEIEGQDEHVWHEIVFTLETCPCCPCEYQASVSMGDSGPLGFQNGDDHFRTQHGNLISGNWQTQPGNHHLH